MSTISKYKFITIYNCFKFSNLKQLFSNSKRSTANLLDQFSEITIILTVWKRDNLSEQLEAILNQTEKSYQIWICHYENHIDINWVKKKYPNIVIIESNVNLKYFGRFAIAIFVRSKYVWILDDDIIPASSWLGNCRTTCQSENAIISCTGRIIPNEDYFPERMGNVSNYFFGDITPNLSYNFCQENIIVDFGCNGWFIKSDWLKTFWEISPFTLETAEDIHLSAVCKLKLGVPTIVLKQVDERTTGNLKIAYGRDVFASWTKPGFLESRERVIRYFIEQKNWQPLLWNKHTENV